MPRVCIIPGTLNVRESEVVCLSGRTTEATHHWHCAGGWASREPLKLPKSRDLYSWNLKWIECHDLAECDLRKGHLRVHLNNIELRLAKRLLRAQWVFARIGVSMYPGSAKMLVTLQDGNGVPVVGMVSWCM